MTLGATVYCSPPPTPTPQIYLEIFVTFVKTPLSFMLKPQPKYQAATSAEWIYPACQRRTLRYIYRVYMCIYLSLFHMLRI